MKILFVVQGLFEKSDSIGFDCVYQYGLLREHCGEELDLHVFAERSDPQRYPDVCVEPIETLFDHFADPDATLIYHFCDGWPTLERRLGDFAGRIIIRWHNNTPPWFFGTYSQRSVERTVTGFRTIQRLARQGRYFFMCNSNYTKDQLSTLAGYELQQVALVYPASRYLERRDKFFESAKAQVDADTSGPLHLLFVGRVVAHKGHRHILFVAQEVQRIAKRTVIVTFAGRSDASAHAYVEEIGQLAETMHVELRLPGEVSDHELERLYTGADAFVCMSEHEGFGLPVYEAMARQVPVVVWSNTAFTEILADHPLAFARPDHTDIAHSIVALADPLWRDKILAYQCKHILPQYTQTVVLTQLLDAIKAAQDIVRVQNGIAIDCRAVSIPMEIANNLVTAYDLASYEVLLQRISCGVFGRWERQFITASQFLAKEGFVRTDPYTSTDLTSDTQVIFGPYISFTAGSYRAEFVMNLTGIDLGRSNGFHFDIAMDGDTILAATDVPSTILTESISCTVLDFRIDAEQAAARIEFRLRPFGFTGHEFGKMTFWGVRLTDLTSKTSAPNGRDGHSYADDNLDHVEFLSQCYYRLLGRRIDNDGLSHYLSCLKGGAMSRREVIEDILSSDESRLRYFNGQAGTADRAMPNANT